MPNFVSHAIKNSLYNGVDGHSPCYHADLGVVFQHLPTQVTHDGRQGSFARLPLRQLGNAGMAQIMQANLQAGILQCLHEAGASQQGPYGA
jgi:hypothetical protein